MRRDMVAQEVTEIWIGPTSDVAWPADGLACPDGQSIALTAFSLSPPAKRAAARRLRASRCGCIARRASVLPNMYTLHRQYIRS